MADALSVLVYGIGQLFPILLIAFGWRAKTRTGSALYLAAFVPLCVLAAMRDPSVGTDTEAYVAYFDALDCSNGVGLDAGFGAFALAAKSLGMGGQGFLASQAGFCWIAYSVGAFRADRVLPILGAGLLPVLFVDATFNGLRYGMAFAILLVLVERIDRAGSTFGDLFAVVPGLVHSAMLLVVFARRRLVWLLPVALAAIAYLVVSDGTGDIGKFIEWKFSEYSEIQRPAWYSGMLPLIQALILAVLSKELQCDLKWGPNIATVGTVVILVSVPMLFMSYAALRFLQLGVFLYAVAVTRAGKTATNAARVEVGILGMVSVANFWRQIFGGGLDGLVVFVPYRFFFN